MCITGSDVDKTIPLTRRVLSAHFRVFPFYLYQQQSVSIWTRTMDVHFFVIVSLMLIIIGLLVFFICGLCFWLIFYNRKRVAASFGLPSRAELEHFNTAVSTNEHFYEEIQDIKFENSEEYIDDNISSQAAFLTGDVHDNSDDDNSCISAQAEFFDYKSDTDSETGKKEIDTVVDVHQYYVLEHDCSGACNCENYQL